MKQQQTNRQDTDKEYTFAIAHIFMWILLN